MSANGGTIFLDEIGELPLPIQVKLLRVLQENEVTPLGASRPRKLDVRIISATNRTLMEEVGQRRFREDLFYRLAVSILTIPPLRDRAGDIGLLIDHILGRLNLENEQLQLEQKILSPGARNILLGYQWPGNIRELQNTLLRASIISHSNRIGEEDVRESILSPAGAASMPILDRPLGEGLQLQGILAEVASHYLKRALREASGNKSRAARLLGLANYQTFDNWMKKYGLD